MNRYIRQIMFGAGLLLLLAGCGEQASDYNQQGNELHDQKRYGEALGQYKEAEKLAPDRAEPFANAGNARYQLGDYLGAVDEQQNGLSVADPEQQSTLHYNLGNAYYRLSEWEQAIESYKETLRLDPDDEDAKYNLELAQRQLENQQQSSDLGRPDPLRRGEQERPGEEDPQQQPGGGQQERPQREPPPSSMSREQAEDELNRLRRREQRRGDDIYRDYAVGGDEGNAEEAQPGGPDRGW